MKKKQHLLLEPDTKTCREMLYLWERFCPFTHRMQTMKDLSEQNKRICCFSISWLPKVSFPSRIESNWKRGDYKFLQAGNNTHIQYKEDLCISQLEHILLPHILVAQVQWLIFMDSNNNNINRKENFVKHSVVFQNKSQMTWHNKTLQNRYEVNTRAYNVYVNWI